MPDHKVFIANRGEIAVRIVRAARDIGLRTVVGYSQADADSLAVALADEAICIGPAPAAASYLSIAALISGALATRCTMIHPGFGFLSENADFAQTCEDHDLIFLGPSPDTIRAMGDKLSAKRLAVSVGVPTLPSLTGDEATVPGAVAAAGLRYPLLIKASAGGGGRGMRVIGREQELADNLQQASAEALAAFNDGNVFVERYIPVARHVEVQVFGWGDGNVVVVGDRDCSTQRRHQKLIEECPAPDLPRDVRAKLHSAAARLAAAVGYRSAGTVEFVLDPADFTFYFLEMNTRLQVEHPVTEEAFGVDLALMQLRLAQHEIDPVDVEVPAVPALHSLECRIAAEDPRHGFRPEPGVLETVSWPAGPGVRIDSGVRAGDRISPFYDSMFAKLIVTGPDRPAALRRMRRALSELRIAGIATTADFLAYVVSNPDFTAGRHFTRWVESTALEEFLKEDVR
jgi:acetyl-CoA carboxylase biotin carboxylase subunit